MGQEIDINRIPQETKEWLDSQNVHWYDSPMVCIAPQKDNDPDMSFSYDYLTSTPLEEIKKGYEGHLKTFAQFPVKKIKLVSKETGLPL